MAGAGEADGDGSNQATELAHTSIDVRQPAESDTDLATKVPPTPPIVGCCGPAGGVVGCCGPAAGVVG